MVCTVGSTKGGVGKSTVAVNLAIALQRQLPEWGHLAGAGRVLLIDGDQPQGTAMGFTQLRTARFPEGPGYTAVALQGAAISTKVRQLAGHYAHIVIDVGGRDDSSLRAALMVSQLLLIPVVPRSPDLWGAEQTADLMRQAREINGGLRAVAFLNAADAAGEDNSAALAALKDLEGVRVSEAYLVRRKAYHNAFSRGLSVLEYSDPSNRAGSLKAREDFLNLFHTLFPAERRITA